MQGREYSGEYRHNQPRDHSIALFHCSCQSFQSMSLNHPTLLWARMGQRVAHSLHLLAVMDYEF